MTRRIDITNQRFGRLIAVECIGRFGRHGHTHWKVLCDCGRETLAQAGNLRNGSIKSCGCLKAEIDRVRLLKHGFSAAGKSSRAHRIWMGIRKRCFNQRCEAYPRYGGRGITLCDAWRESFDAFFADMGECPDGMTIERVDNDGPYSPDNCVWATYAEQNHNKRNNIIVWDAGERLVLRQYAERHSLPYKWLTARIRENGETPEAAAAYIRIKQANNPPPNPVNPTPESK